MAQKKSFKSALSNPAMQFISVPEEPVQEVVQTKASKLKQVAKEPAPTKSEAKPAKTPNKEKTKAQTNEPAAPKIPLVKEQKETASSAPEGYKINPMYIEVKSKRVQLVLQPSLFEKVKKLAEKNNDSVNNTIHAILEKATNNE